MQRKSNRDQFRKFFRLIYQKLIKRKIITRTTVAKNAFFRLVKSLWSHRENTIKTKVHIDIAACNSPDRAIRDMANVLHRPPQELSYISLFVKSPVIDGIKNKVS